MKILMVIWLTHPEIQGAMYIYEMFNERQFEIKKDRWLEGRLGPWVGKINGISEKMIEKLTNVSKSNITLKEGNEEEKKVED
jgi:hypothetical protein